MSDDRCVGCGGTGVLFFDGVERIPPDGEGTVTCCVVERCDKCGKYPSDVAAMARARYAVREQQAVDHISRGLREEEDKRILSEMEKLPADEYVERLADAIEEKLPSEALEALRGGTAVVTHVGTAYPPNSALVQEECSLILTEEGKAQLAESMQRFMQRRK